MPRGCGIGTEILAAGQISAAIREGLSSTFNGILYVNSVIENSRRWLHPIATTVSKFREGEEIVPIEFSIRERSKKAEITGDYSNSIHSVYYYYLNIKKDSPHK